MTVQMSAELLEQLREGWSPPVQIRVDPPVEPGTHWIMSVRMDRCRGCTSSYWLDPKGREHAHASGHPELRNR